MEEDHYTRITLRIPTDLHDQLVRAAFDTSKSKNAEIIARLRGSFEPAAFEIPTFLSRAPESAVSVTDSGAVVLHLTLTPGMTVEKLLELLEAAQMALPEGAQVVVDTVRQG